MFAFHSLKFPSFSRINNNLAEDDDDRDTAELLSDDMLTVERARGGERELFRIDYVIVIPVVPASVVDNAAGLQMMILILMMILIMMMLRDYM